MMKVSVYNKKAENVGNVTLSGFSDAKWNPTTVSFVYEGMMRNQRRPLSHAKGRGEVRGGGKKPWRQKGTGRARHGSIRSPIWRGGGVTHGPIKNKNYGVKLNRKMKQQAFQSVLARKIKDEEIFTFESLDVSEGKTKSLVLFLENIEKKFKIKILGESGSGSIIVVVKKYPTLERAARNVPHLFVKEARSVSLVDMLNSRYILLEKEVLQNYGAV